jgi:hypothetical protein
VFLKNKTGGCVLTNSLLEKIRNHHCGRNIKNLTITHKDGFIILGGITSSYYLKQIVQELISKDVVAQNLVLHNRITVVYGNAE